MTFHYTFHEILVCSSGILTIWLVVFPILLDSIIPYSPYSIKTFVVDGV